MSLYDFVEILDFVRDEVKSKLKRRGNELIALLDFLWGCKDRLRAKHCAEKVLHLSDDMGKCLEGRS
jgi:hypothetical protein